MTFFWRMVKKSYKAFLEPGNYEKLRQKAQLAGFEGNGWLGKYMSWLTEYPIVILSPDYELKRRCKPSK